MVFIKKELFKIPSYIAIYYLKKNQLIIFNSGNTQNFFKVSRILGVLFFKNKIYLMINFKNLNLNHYNFRILKTLMNTVKYKIKLGITETTHKLYTKLRLVGIGYKVLKFKDSTTNVILLFRLGFSHMIFIKLNKNEINLCCLKNIKIFITGSLFKTTPICALIKSFKKPEVYKGKGIRFHNQKIILKPIKKK